MGTQSTAILHLVEIGRLPMPDVWVFADTGDEPKSVYRQLEWAAQRIKAMGQELAIVKHESGKSLSEVYIEGILSGESPPQPPLFIPDPERLGARMPMRRQCTERFKIRVIKRYLRERFEIRSGAGAQVVQWMGISMDEAHRMKPPHAGWYDVAYPLIDMVPMRRTDCYRLLEDAGIAAPRSACVYCPYHSNAEWRRLKTEEPDDFKSAVRFERAVHRAHELRGRVSGQRARPYLHRSGVPIDEIDFDAQGELFGGWGNECAGVCGV
jgi:hypothetical protein